MAYITKFKEVQWEYKCVIVWALLEMCKSDNPIQFEHAMNILKEEDERAYDWLFKNDKAYMV